jgi:hypothetical protein
VQQDQRITLPVYLVVHLQPVRWRVSAVCHSILPSSRAPARATGGAA